MSSNLSHKHKNALRALAGVGGTVVAVQGLSFVANLIVIRALSVAEYALLTSSLSILGVMTAIADSGLSQAAMTVGGLHHDNAREKAEILQRCRSLVLKTGSVGFIVISPVWVWMAQKFDVSSASMIALGISLFAGFFISLGVNIYKSILLLDGKRNFTQKIEVIKTVLRVGLVIAGLAILPNTALVIACALISESFAWLVFRKSLRPYLESKNVCGPNIRLEINHVFRKLMPTTIYKALSPQIFLLLLVALGSTASVAGAGALSRFQQVFIFVPSIVANILTPRLAKTREWNQRNRLMVLFIIASWTAACCILVSLWLLTTPLLSLLGPEYSSLKQEFRVMMGSTCLNVMNGACHGLQNARAWIMPPTVMISSGVLCTVAAILLCDVSTLMGFSLMHCILAMGSLATSVGWIIFCFFRQHIHKPIGFI